MWWIIGIVGIICIFKAKKGSKTAKGCLTVIGGIALIFVLIFVDAILSPKAEVEQKRQEQERKVQEQAARRQKLENREAKLREFAIKEVPDVWKTYQTLEGDISGQDQNISELRKTLETFGKNPDEDADYKRIVAMRDEMIRARKSLHAKLENLYLASRKFAAAPSRKDYQELHRKAMEDGILEADAVETKFKEMRLNK